ncbi:hypothetical protein EI94DRAFT_1814508 [Lactarius quietus]|nr:hypothetical protein EI94DRAFT_1814508 [Lactarius quietus]
MRLIVVCMRNLSEVLAVHVTSLGFLRLIASTKLIKAAIMIAYIHGGMVAGNDTSPITGKRGAEAEREEGDREPENDLI